MRRPQVAAPESPAATGRFAAGLAVATLGPLALAPVLAPARGGGTSELLGVLVVVAYAGHVAVTGWLWTVPDVRQTGRDRPFRLTVLPGLLVAAGVVSAVALPRDLLSWLLLGFFGWQFDHFQRQNLGLVKLIERTSRSEPTGDAEHLVIVLAGWCGVAALVSRPTLLGLHGVVLPIALDSAVVRMASVAYATCVVAAFAVALRRRRTAAVSTSVLVAVMFVSPVFVFHSAGAAVTGMVVAHGLQYLWVVRRRSRQARSTASRAQWPATLAVVLGAVVGGSLLEAMSELHSAHGALMRALYGGYLGIVAGHFSLDAVLWRRSSRPGIAVRLRGALVPSLAEGRL